MLISISPPKNLYFWGRTEWCPNSPCIVVTYCHELQNLYYVALGATFGQLPRSTNNNNYYNDYYVKHYVHINTVAFANTLVF